MISVERLDLNSQTNVNKGSIMQSSFLTSRFSATGSMKTVLEEVSLDPDSGSEPAEFDRRCLLGVMIAFSKSDSAILIQERALEVGMGDKSRVLAPSTGSPDIPNSPCVKFYQRGNDVRRTVGKRLNSSCNDAFSVRPPGLGLK